MAQRRMFTKAITNSSEFLMMPPTAQLLYIHFGMNADDDGFCEHFSIMRMTDSKPDDLRILQARKFVRVFDDKVLVITDWKENNYIQKDRYTPSKYLKVYKEELKQLGSSVNTGESGDCTQDVYNMDTQVRLGKVRVGKNTSKETGVSEGGEEIKGPKEPEPVFSLPDEIKKMEESPRRDLNIIAFLIDRKGLQPENKGQLHTIIKRHLRPAKDLKPFSDADIVRASKVAQEEYPDKWTGETLVKILTK